MSSSAESFQNEKYKVIIDRQKFYANLSREIFDKYAKVFLTLAAGTLAIISAKEKLEIAVKLTPKLINGIAVLITFMENLQLGYSVHKPSSKKHPFCLLSNDMNVPMNIGSLFRIKESLAQNSSAILHS